MMRPSHPVPTILQSHPVARRVAAAGLVVLVQMMVVWALVCGLASRALCGDCDLCFQTK
jgi:hypothetical protein